jgi:hypothetical protein
MDTFGDHSQGSVGVRLWVFLHRKHGEFEGCLQFRVGDVGVSEPETHGADESLVFWRFTGEVLSHKADLVDSAFPAFAFSLSRSDDFKHLGLSHRLDLFDGN